MDIQSFIAARRDGRTHAEEDLRDFANAAADGKIADYQISAWLMAAYLNPLSQEETAWLTMAMADSGERMDLEGLPHPWVDKHSTGGVGDKTSLVLLPILASCGLTVIKMSGRGLGITGGTVDKLSSIPGFDLDLSPEQLKEQARSIGLALTGQTPDLAPADKVLYALRDATGTVSSIPLIVSSILSKKLAGGAEMLVLDVKCGSGAFMPDLAAAAQLADQLLITAELIGLPTRLAITDMDQPLGRAVGNALEVKEALEVLQNKTKNRFSELCINLAGLTLNAAGKAGTIEDGKRLARQALEGGDALVKATEWFAAQGTTEDVFAHPEKLPSAKVVQEVRASKGGYIQRVDARTIGQAIVDLGGGRKSKEDPIDLGVGVETFVNVGDAIETGTSLFRVYARTEDEAEATARSIQEAVVLSEAEVPQTPLILEIR